MPVFSKIVGEKEGEHLIPVMFRMFGLACNRKFAARFGKDDRFAWKMTVFPFIHYPILAFGDSEYQPLKEKEQ